MIREDYYPLLIKYAISTTVGNSNNAVYSEWNTIYALKENPTGYVERVTYGITFDYDRIIIVDASNLTRKIKENTVFLINEYPTINNKYGNYIVSKKFPEYLGKITIALKNNQSNALPRIYYFDNTLNQVLAYQINFDFEKMRGYVGKYDDIPFNSNSKIWFREPLSKDDNEYVMKFISQQMVGIVKNLKVYKELIFEQANI